MIEIVIVVVLFAIFVPSALSLFISARKINGRSYIQHAAATTLSETNDIIVYMRNLSFGQLVNGDYFLIRNPGGGSWLVKNDLPDKELFERRIDISSAYRNLVSGNLCPDVIDAAGAVSQGCATDDDTKRIEVSIVWAPDYTKSETMSQTLYVTDWERDGIVY